MKKITPYILIFFIFVNLFAPISLELSSEKINVNKNIASAADPSGGSIKLKGYITKTDTSITIYTAVNFETNNWRTSGEKVVVMISDSANKLITFKDKDGNIVNATIMEPHNINDGTAVLPTEIKNAISDSSTTTYYKKVFYGLNANTSYNVSLYATHTVTSWWTIAAASAGTAVGIASIIITAGATAPLVIAAGTAIAGGSAIAVGQTINVKNDENTVIMDPPEITVTTNTAGDSQNKVADSNITESNKTSATNMPACSMNPLSSSGSVMGCVAQGIYYVLFQPTSYLFALSGTLFDNAFAYSVDDNSYRSAFVVEGWKVVRDFCNMFFIFILLYIAFGTILNLNGVKTKEMIINVVLIGIFINFSLFASQVIIDASNILARVFYNSNTITVKIEDAAVGSSVIPLSAALVNKINPQQIILNASQVDMVKDTRGKSGSDTGEVTTSNGISTGTFILVTLLATIVNLVGVFVFLSVSLIFIARVIGLWLSMIFVPFAFLSYTVPAMQDFEMVGWKRWWPDTLKMAFLAPVFIFFIYLILQFLETGLGLVKTDATAGGLSFVIGIIFPFAIIMILLLKAKDIATKMSGTIGETIAKAGSTVGGLALGAATGGAAFAARGTLGRMGSSIMNNDKITEAASKKGIAGFGARTLRSVGGVASKGSFDARATKLGGMAGKATGMDFGKAQGTGGFEKSKADQKAKLQKKAKELEVGENSPLKQKLNEKEAGLKMLQNNNSKDLERLEVEIGLKRQVQTEKTQAATADPTEENKKAAAAAVKDLNDSIKAKKDISAGGEIMDENGKPTGKYNTTNGNISQTEVDDNEKEATNSETAAIAATANKSKISTDAAKTKKDSIKKAEEIETTTNEKAVNEANDMVSRAEEKSTRASAAYSSAKIAAQSDPSMAANADKAKEAYEKANKEVEETKKNADNKIVQAALDAKSAKESAIKDAERVEVETTLNADNAEINAIKKAGEDRTKANISNARAAEAKTKGGMGNSIGELMKTEIPTARAEYNKENNERRVNISNRYKSKSNKVTNFILSGGQYSAKTADQAAHAVIMDIKSEGSK